MAKKWEPPYQDHQPVIGLGYLEKNYGKDATEITEISLQGLLRTFFRLTSETSDNTLASVLWTVFRLTLEISETSQCIYYVMLRILRRFLGDISDNSFVNCISEMLHVDFGNFGKFAYVVVVVAVGLN